MPPLWGRLPDPAGTENTPQLLYCFIPRLDVAQAALRDVSAEQQVLNTS